jgi:multiple sugar transport system permease protein
MASRTPETRPMSIVLRYAVLVLVALIFVFPLAFMLVSSLKPSMQLLSDTSSIRAFLPVGDISFRNYAASFARAPVALFIFNSIFITSVTVALNLVICSMAGFSFAFLDWRGKHVMLSIVIATLIVPLETIAIPLLLVVNNLPWIGADGIEWGWLNSYRVQIVPFLSDALTVFLFVQYFRDLPRDLIEAARIDGASWFQIYVKVIMPISGPVIATAAILRFLARYNQ